VGIGFGSQSSAPALLVLALLSLLLVSIAYFYFSNTTWTLLELSSIPNISQLQLVDVYQSGQFLVLTLFNPTPRDINIQAGKVFFYLPGGDLVAITDFNATVPAGSTSIVKVLLPYEVVSRQGTYIVKVSAGGGAVSFQVSVDVSLPVADLSLTILSLSPTVAIDKLYYGGVLYYSPDGDIDAQIRVELNILNGSSEVVSALLSVDGNCTEPYSASVSLWPGENLFTITLPPRAAGNCELNASVKYVLDPDIGNNNGTASFIAFYLYGCSTTPECVSDVAAACSGDYNAVVLLQQDIDGNVDLSQLECNWPVTLEGNLHRISSTSGPALSLSSVSGLTVKDVNIYGSTFLQSSSAKMLFNLSRSSFFIYGSPTFSIDENSSLVLDCVGTCDGSQGLLYAYFDDNDINFASFVLALAPPVRELNSVTVVYLEPLGQNFTDYVTAIDVNSEHFPPDFNTASLIAMGLLDGNCSALKVVDARGRELNFWLEGPTCNRWDTRMYVRLPELPDYGMVLYIEHENDTSYPSRSNGPATFHFFDDFEGGIDKWTVVDRDGDGCGIIEWSATSTRTISTPWDGNYIVKYCGGNVTDLYDGGMAKVSPPRSFILETEAYSRAASDGIGEIYYQDGVGVLVSDVNGYYVRNAHGESTGRLDVLVSGVATTLASATTGNYTGRWFYRAFVVDTSSGLLRGVGYLEDGTLWMDINTFDNNFVSFTVVAIGGGDFSYYDNVRVSNYPWPPARVLRTLTP